MAKQEVKKKVNEIQVVIFRLRNEEFAVSITSVLEILRMIDTTHIPQAPGFIEGVINLRGQVIAVVDIARQFGFEKQEHLPKTARIAVVEVGGQTVGLIVDEVPEVLRIPEDNIEATPEIIQTQVQRDYIKGVAKLDDRLVILLDLEKVFSSQEVEAVGKIGEQEEQKT